MADSGPFSFFPATITLPSPAMQRFLFPHRAFSWQYEWESGKKPFEIDPINPGDDEKREAKFRNRLPAGADA
jgi:hypothetical protein